MGFSKTNIALTRPVTYYGKVKTALGHLLRGQRFQLARRSAFRKPYLDLSVADPTFIRASSTSTTVGSPAST